MLNNIVIQKFVDDICEITKVNLCVLDVYGEVLARTFDLKNITKNYIIEFLHSDENIQTIKEYILFKIEDELDVQYIIIIKGVTDNHLVIGKICMSQLKNLIFSSKTNNDKNTFMQSLILGNISSVELHNKAQKLGIKDNVCRVAIIIEIYTNKENSLKMIRNIIEENERDFIISIDGNSIIILKRLSTNNDYKDVIKIANILIDMFNTELMSKAKIFYGTIENELSKMAKSFEIAKISREIGNIFYKEKNIVGYDNLGVGRLIYKLPIELCDIFINEVFKGYDINDFDEEIITTVYKFFENDLNISETSRKLYIHRNTLVYRLEKIQKITGLDIKIFEDALILKLALMVLRYIKYLKNE